MLRLTLWLMHYLTEKIGSKFLALSHPHSSSAAASPCTRRRSSFPVQLPLPPLSRIPLPSAPAAPPFPSRRASPPTVVRPSGSELRNLLEMGKTNKNKKQADKHGPATKHMDMQDEVMDIKKIMKDVEDFSYSHMTWKERKKIENKKIVSLGGKPPKNQRLPLSVARPMMKKQKEREEKMLQERLILGRFGGKLGDSSKRPVGKHKPEDRGLKSSEGRFRNGILDVRHLLNSGPSRDRDTMNVSRTKEKKGSNMKRGKRGSGKKSH